VYEDEEEDIYASGGDDTLTGGGASFEDPTSFYGEDQPQAAPQDPDEIYNPKPKPIMWDDLEPVQAKPVMWDELEPVSAGPQTHDGLPARQNADGSHSTEVSITVTDPRLNGGRPTNIPSLWGGEELDEEDAVEQALQSGNTYQAFNDIQSAVAAAQQRSAQGGAGKPVMWDELEPVGPARKWSEAETLGVHAANSAVPTAAGMAAGIKVGGAVAAATAIPLTPIGGAIAGGLAGLATGLGVGWLTNAAQDVLLALTGFDKPVKDALAESEAQNPWSAAIGEAAPSAAFLRPNMKAFDVANRAISAGIGGGIEAGKSILHGDEEWDLRRLAVGVVGGAALPSLNRVGNKFAYRGGNDVPANATPSNVGGVAAEASPVRTAGDFEAIGNPTSGAGSVHVAQGGDSSYVKGKPVVSEAANDNPGTAVVQRTDVQPDMAQALTPEPTPGSRPTADVPAAREAWEAPPPANDNAKLVEPINEPIETGIGRQAQLEAPGNIRPQPVDGEVLPPEAPARGRGLQNPLDSELHAINRRINELGPDPDAMTPAQNAEMDRLLTRANEIVDLKNKDIDAPAQDATPRIGDNSRIPGTLRLKNPRPEPDVNRPPPEGPVETGLTVDGLKKLAEHRQALSARMDNDTPFMKNFWKRLNALPPKEQLSTLVGAIKAAQSKSGMATGGKDTEGRTIVQPKKVTATGRITNSEAHVTRANKAIETWETAYAKHGPDTGTLDGVEINNKANRATVQDWAKNTWEEIKHANGGRDPLIRGNIKDPAGNYLPNKDGHGKEQQLQWLRAVKAVATATSKKGGAPYDRLAALHVKQERAIGDNGGPKMDEATTKQTMGELDAKTGQIEAAIAKRPGLPDVVMEERAISSGDLAGGMAARVDFEPYVARPTDPTPRHAARHNDLRDWVNNLDDAEYRMLEAANPDFQKDIATTKHPAKLHAQWMDELDAAKQKTPGVLEHPAEDSEVANVRAWRADDVQPKQKNIFQKLATDESGALGIGKVGDDIKAVLKRTTARLSNWRHRLDVGTEERAQYDYAQEQHADIAKAHDNVLEIQDHVARVLRNIDEEVTLSARQWRKLTIAMERGEHKVRKLPQDLQDVYDRHLKPMQKVLSDLYDDLMSRLTPEEAKRLGLHKPEPGVDVQYLPHNKVGEQFFDKQTEFNSPFHQRSLSGVTAHTMQRKYFVLRDMGPDPDVSSPRVGKRIVVEVDGKASTGYTVKMLRSGMPSLTMTNMPRGWDPTQVGNRIGLKIKGTSSVYQVDYAATPEIERASGRKVKYHENAAYNLGRGIESVAASLEQIKLKHKLINSPEFKQWSTPDADEAKAKGWVETRLKGPEFEGKYFAPRLAWELDDYARAGIGANSNFWNRVRAFNQGVAKWINVNAPFVQVLNIADIAIVSRGHRWGNPMSYVRGGQSLVEAVKMITSQDLAFHKRARASGLNFMLGANRGVTRFLDFARHQGLDTKALAHEFDLAAKATPWTAPQLWEKVQQWSGNATWYLADIITAQHWLELQKEGLSPKEAADRTNKFLPDYRTGTTLISKGGAGRATQQLLTEPGLTLFGRYKANVFRAMKSIYEGLVSKDPQKTGEALAQTLVWGALLFGGYSAVDKGVQALAGNEDAYLRRRGMTAFPNAATDVVTGKKHLGAALAHTFSPAPAIPLGLDLWSNADWRGKQIYPQDNWLENPGVIPEGAGKIAEHVLKSTISPYNQISSGFTDDGAKGAAKALALEQIGVSDPTDRAVKFGRKQDKRNRQERVRRAKRPEGVIPNAVEWFRQ
jgi:hypothetical protein